MPTKLIELEDGTFIEVELQEGHVQQISGSFAEKVSSNLDRIQPLLVKICDPIAAAWEGLSEKMNIEQVEIEVGISFECEGNLYVTKSKAGSNIMVKLIVNPNTEE